MNTNEINKTIASMEPYSVLCSNHTWKCIKKHSQGHKYWKTKGKDIYYYLDADRLFMFEKDFGGNYRFKEIESQDVRLLEALDEHTWMWQGPGITHDYDNMIVYIENGPLINN